MKPERRQHTRVQPDSIAYLGLEPENGGIVLDISEGGLGFHAVAPVVGTQPIRFWFSLKAGDRLEGIGELIWIDKTRKVGGMRFTHLAEGVLEQIRSLAGRSTLPTTPVARLQEISGGRLSEEPASAPPRHQDTASFQARNPTIVPSQFGLGSEPEPMWDPMPDFEPPSRSQFVPTVTTGLLVLLALTGIFLFHTYHRELGDTLVRLGERIAPKTQSQVAPPAPSPALPPANPPPADSLPADKTNTPDASSESVLTPTTPLPTEPSVANPPAENPARSEQIVPQQSLRGKNPKQQPASGPRQLWAAVEKGDTSAEVLLADLYRSGHGVKKSCAQARALLIAASRKGNTRAMEKLRELNRNGCR